MFNNLSENLKELRVKNNLTQSELSSLLGISRQSLSNYEKGIREPDLFTITKIAKYFNYSIDYLIFNNTKVDSKQLYKSTETEKFECISNNIVDFLEDKKKELSSLYCSIPNKIKELDYLIDTLKSK